MIIYDNNNNNTHVVYSFRNESETKILKTNTKHNYSCNIKTSHKLFTC